MLGPPRQTRGRDPLNRRGRYDGEPYRVGDVAIGVRSRWVILAVSRSARTGLKYPWRITIGPIARDVADALIAAGADSYAWRWDRRPKRTRA